MRSSVGCSRGFTPKRMHPFANPVGDASLRSPAFVSELRLGKPASSRSPQAKAAPPELLARRRAVQAGPELRLGRPASSPSAAKAVRRSCEAAKADCPITASFGWAAEPIRSRRDSLCAQSLPPDDANTAQYVQRSRTRYCFYTVFLLALSGLTIDGSRTWPQGASSMSWRAARSRRATTSGSPTMCADAQACITPAARNIQQAVAHGI